MCVWHLDVGGAGGVVEDYDAPSPVHRDGNRIDIRQQTCSGQHIDNTHTKIDLYERGSGDSGSAIPVTCDVTGSREGSD